MVIMAMESKDTPTLAYCTIGYTVRVTVWRILNRHTFPIRDSIRNKKASQKEKKKTKNGRREMNKWIDE